MADVNFLPLPIERARHSIKYTRGIGDSGKTPPYLAVGADNKAACQRGGRKMELSSRSKHPLLAPLSSDKTDSRGARKIERERRTLGTWALGETNVGHQHPAIYPSLPVAHVWKTISYRTDEFIDGDYRKDPRNVRFSARSRNCTYNWYLKGEVMTYESRSSRSLADLFHFAANALVCASRPLPRCKTYRLGHRQPRQTFLVAGLPPSLPPVSRQID